MTIKLIVGLRNPGSAYEHTRHNAGEWFSQSLVQRHHGVFKTEKKLHCDLAVITISQHPCKVILPATFMNHNGLPVREVSQFFRIEAQEILVVHDELDLPIGSAKLKTAGGNGGHNGLRDVTSQLGTGEFHRLRIGIGHPGHKDMVLDYVLGKPSAKDRQLMFDAIERAVAIMPLIMNHGVAAAMNQLNS